MKSTILLDPRTIMNENIKINLVCTNTLISGERLDELISYSAINEEGQCFIQESYKQILDLYEANKLPETISVKVKTYKHKYGKCEYINEKIYIEGTLNSNYFI